MVMQCLPQDVVPVFPWEQPDAGKVRTGLGVEKVRHRGGGNGDQVEAFQPAFTVGDAVEMQFGKMVGSPYWSSGTVVKSSIADGTVDIEFGEKSRWMDRRPGNYFLKQGATGSVAGREVAWKPAAMTVVDTQSGEVLHDLHAGFKEMDRVIRTALFASLRKIARERTLTNRTL